MNGMNSLNPFAKRESYTSRCVRVYQALTILSWLLAVLTSIYYAFNYPTDGRYPRRSIWEQNRHFHTPFTMNSLIASLYFLVLFISQLCYIGHLFAPDTVMVTHASSVASHFITNNLFHFGFVMLFVRSLFGWAELLLILNFINLTILYFRHNTYHKFIHFPAISGPLAWTFVAIFWNGAIWLHKPSPLVARVFGNILIWGILAYGMLYIVAYKDYTMGFALSVLAAAIGVGQFFTKAIALQWIFAFTIMALLFVISFGIAIPIWMGKDIGHRSGEQDPERNPLLRNN